MRRACSNRGSWCGLLVRLREGGVTTERNNVPAREGTMFRRVRRSAALAPAVGLVRAERARAHRPVEVAAEGGGDIGDLLDRLADAPLGGDARAFGVGPDA